MSRPATAGPTGAITVTLVIFAVAALPGHLLAAFTIDRIGRKFMQAGGFALIAAAFTVIVVDRNPRKTRSFCPRSQAGHEGVGE
jgi:sugar phosphate permease